MSALRRDIAIKSHRAALPSGSTGVGMSTGTPVGSSRGTDGCLAGGSPTGGSAAGRLDTLETMVASGVTTCRRVYLPGS